MKAVMLSLRPQWCEKIFNGSKSIEVRKSRPSMPTPFTVYVYQTKIKFKVKNWQENFQSIVFTPNGGVEDGNGKVIGSFVCDRIDEIKPDLEYYSDGYDIDDDRLAETCLTREQLREYGNGVTLYGWHITAPKLYDKPKELGEFVKPCDWNYDCCTCKRAVYELTKAEAKLFYGCDREITRPPQSWCYVEELQ